MKVCTSLKMKLKRKIITSARLVLTSKNSLRNFSELSSKNNFKVMK